MKYMNNLFKIFFRTSIGKKKTPNSLFQFLFTSPTIFYFYYVIFLQLKKTKKLG